MGESRYAMLIDVRRCIGCNACTVACKQEFGVAPGVWRTWIKAIEKGRYPDVSISFLPLMCNHCERPSCVTVCPVLATYKREDGIVVIDPHRCIGCRYCMAACPYSMRFLNPKSGCAQKCDWCAARVDKGLQPACVEACPTGALIFGDLADKNSEIFKLMAANPTQVVKPETGNEPHAFYIGLDSLAVETT
jgi:tetrathionate reductase subunit B